MKTLKIQAALTAAILLAAIGAAPSITRAQTDAPEISRSGGVDGGIVVLWPRIIPGEYRSTARNDAALVQSWLVQLAKEAFPGRPIDVRPEPERVCGQGGCRSLTLGAVILRDQGGVAVLATVSEPGRSPARIVEWTGVVTVRSQMVPFREPPENHVTVRDFGLTRNLSADLSEHDAAVLQAIRDAGR